MKIKQTTVAKYAAVFAFAFAVNLAMAATTGAEFKGLADMVSGWSEGYLGMSLGLTAFLIGLAVGLMKQTVMPCIVGLGVCLAATLGPGIIKGMFTLII
ncbi:TPA: TraA family conjugative transfer protein [Neisseria meningitidis]